MLISKIYMDSLTSKFSFGSTFVLVIDKNLEFQRDSEIQTFSNGTVAIENDSLDHDMQEPG